jgi:hypothetical protein
MATVYEWRITDKGNGEYGHIWIAEVGKDDFGPVYMVYADPENYDRWIGNCDWLEGNMIRNIMGEMECPEEFNEYQRHPSWYRRVLFYWRRIGSPHIDRKAAGFEAPWFPWAEAGFTDEERDACIKPIAAEPSPADATEQHLTLVDLENI